MRIIIAAAAITGAALLGGCGGGGSEPDLAACEQAMRDQFAASMDALESGQTPEEGSQPPECEGVSDQQLEEIANKLIGEAFEGN